MGYKPTVFNQLFNFIPRYVFEKSVKTYQADRYAKSFKAWQQFLLLLYAQATGKQSLRDIEGGLELHRPKLYHLGLSPVPRSTISDGMERRDSKLFEEMFHAMVRKAGAMAPGHRFRFKNDLYSIDATTIDLCLNVFDWAKFRKQKGAIKLHCQLDHSGHIPSFVHISDGKLHDAKGRHVISIFDWHSHLSDSWCWGTFFHEYRCRRCRGSTMSKLREESIAQK